jgi:hypothetical protein
MTSLETGTLPGAGSFRCTDCDYVLTLAAFDELPACPTCGGASFERASLFTQEDTTVGPHPDQEPAEWLTTFRRGLSEPGDYLAWEEDGEVHAYALGADWTRIGRSMAADIRFDDPTVSRRHALVVRGHDGLRVLDDRSLNGVFVNGRRVEWSPLTDGDAILVGRHTLRFLSVEVVSGMREGVTDHGEPLVR